MEYDGLCVNVCLSVRPSDTVSLRHRALWLTDTSYITTNKVCE